MKTKYLFLIAIAFVAFSCGSSQKSKENQQKSTETEISENQVSETTKDIHNIPFSKANIACPSGNGLYGKFPLKQKWTTISTTRNQIITAETKYHYYDIVENLNTSFVEQKQELPFRFDIAFKGIYSEKDIEILLLTPENDDDIINLIKQNLPSDITEKDFYRGKENILPDNSTKKIVDIQLFSFTSNDNKFWIAYYKFQMDYGDEHTSLIGITPDKKIVLLSGRCVIEDVCVLRLKKDFLV